ncbi:MAG TPA: two-component regulator propeller domain-containing protein, partial [Terriglobales bacterium]|nr:two-component regulator propeller domain-containing protein [Terriglobales bacterium]
VEDREGTIWAGSVASPPPGKLCAIGNEAVRCHGDDGSLGRGVIGLYEDGEGNLWVGTENGIWRWKPRASEFFSMPAEPGGVRAFAEDEKGALLIGSSTGMYRLLNGQIGPYAVPGISQRLFAERILRDRDGGLWISSWGHGLVHVHAGKADVFSTADGLSSDIVESLIEDPEGNIWLATLNGLDRFRGYAIPTISVKQGLSNASATAVLAATNGTIWIGTTNALNRWDGGRITVFGSRDGAQKSDGKLDGLPPNSLFQDSSGRIWVSTRREFGYLQNESFIPMHDVPSGSVSSITETAPNDLWLANEQAGLLHFFQQKVVQRIPWSGLGHEDFAWVMVADPSRAGLWLGFRQGGVSYFGDGGIRTSYSTANGLGEGAVNGLRFGPDGALWAATDGGLSRIKDGRVTTLSSKNGLPCDTVHWTMEDAEDSVWLYMSCGLMHIGRPELEQWVANPKRTVKGTIFDNSDGVQSHSVAAGYSPAVTKSPDGKVWFSAWDGISIIDPHRLPFNKIPPPLDIEQIIADRQTYRAAGDLHLPPRVRDLEIDYTALSLVAPEKNRFRYKLEGRDRDWQDVGNRRTAFYTDLPPRNYRFRVIASNNSGVWNEHGVSLDFVIPPAWYQTNWFRSLCLAVFLALIWTLHQVRLHQQARQFNMTLEARVGERTRIARELHDTLLQSFHGLLLQFRAASQLVQPHSQAKQILDTAIERAADAIAESRKTVQGLRTSTVERHDLGKAIRTVGEELAAANAGAEAIAFQVQGVGPRRDLRALMYDEVYRIAIEALRNSFQHAGAKRITVEIHYDPREFRLRISDDGSGIDPELLQGEGLTGHFGLPGMRERAKIIGGRLAVWSSIGEGTEVDLTIPGAKAYSGANGGPWWSGKLSRREKEQGSTAGTGM